MHLVMIFGPPAVGKMTVGHELTKLTGYKLFHNHMTIEPLLEIFDFGSPSFGLLVDEFRRRILEEAVSSGLPGLVFTFAWDLETPESRDLVASYAGIAEAGGWQVSYVELAASLEERLLRNETPFRLEHKRSKRDLDFSRANVQDLDSRWVMNTGVTPTPGEDFLRERGWLRIDNTDLEAAEVARRIVEELDLPRR
jgi:hypothetical protein